MHDDFDTITKAKWAEMHSKARKQIYPSEDVIRWVFGQFPRQNAAQYKILDCGAGTGRHALFMAENGYQVTASDSAKSALKLLESDCAKFKNLKLLHAPAEKQQDPDESYDGILCYGVLYYLSLDKMTKAIDEIYRLLKKGGQAFIMIKNDQDIRAQKGDKGDDFSYVINQSNGGDSWHSENGMALTLLPEIKITELFSKFSECTIDQSHYSSRGGEVVEASSLIFVTK